MITQETLDEIIRRVVEVAAPERIILFGSAARGEIGPHSDVDLLIVKDDPNLRGLSGRLYRRLHGIGAPLMRWSSLLRTCGATRTATHL